MSASYAMGVDYGTNSVRTIIVDVNSGDQVAASVYAYPSGDDGILLDDSDPNLARQHPGDYIEGFLTTARDAVAKSGVDVSRIVGIGVDTTASTPIPIGHDGTPLAMLPEFQRNLNAYAWLWKDHTSHEEAAAITQLAIDRNEPYLAKCGGAYSSEWFWSKVLRCRHVDHAVFDAAVTWVEQADFVTAYLTGQLGASHIPRGICAAGHKAMFHESWGGLPSEAFLGELHQDLASLRSRLYDSAKPSDQSAGGLDPKIAEAIGVPAGIPVAYGAIDAHLGAVGAGVKSGTLVKVLGTSTCDMAVVSTDQDLPDIPGLCGIVPGSIVPGMFGIEAGQAAVGDIFNWFVKSIVRGHSGSDLHQSLTNDAQQLRPGESGLIALDWSNGNRCVLADPLLTGLLVGQTLRTSAAEVYRALIESTAFGALTIIKRFEEHGIQIDQIVNCGGIAAKNAMLMQIYADVCNRPMAVSGSDQTCALGAAICGAVVGKAWGSVEEAQSHMCVPHRQTYQPITKHARTYQRLYELYRQLHDAFGTNGYTGSMSNVMKALIAIRNEVRRGA